MSGERCATVADGGVRFSVWAPHADGVTVRVLSGPCAGEWHLDAGHDGVFETHIAGLGEGVEYAYVLQGAGEKPLVRADPASRSQPRGVHGPSAVVDPSGFPWSDAGWRAPATADLVLYELHVGAFTDAGTFDAVLAELPRLRALGVTAIELMPVAEFPGARNWGYDGVHLYAPQSTYGGPEGLRRLVDGAHRIGIAVLLDVVYNHVGPEGNHLADFGPYFTDRYRTPWGLAVNFDGPDSDEVRRWVIDNARAWIRDFHLDGLRLDAVHAIHDASARHVLEDVAAAVHVEGARAGRGAVVVAESDLNDPRVVRAPERGGYGLDAQWSDDFHHAVHVALTGERGGYYVDFGGAASVAKVLADRFVLDGRRSVHRRRRHGAPAGDVPADRFVVFVQNHDQVGNRALGERLATLVPPERQRLAAAVLLLSPYVPLLFMGEEYGETNPFLYFTSHEYPALAEAVREGRRREFATFAWQGEVPDPQASETFLRSRLDRRNARAPLRRLYEDLLRLRRTEPLLRPGGARTGVVADEEAGWVALRLAAEEVPSLLALFNFGGAQAAVVPGVATGGWDVVLSTDAGAYGGADAAVGIADGRVVLPAWSAVLLRARAV
jgi:maltooligosyltrehalose trehalohydrolase